MYQENFYKYRFNLNLWNNLFNFLLLFVFKKLYSTIHYIIHKLIFFIYFLTRGFKEKINKNQTYMV